MGDKVFNILGALVVVAGVTSIVAHPASANVIRAMGDSFSGAIKAATGRG